MGGPALELARLHLRVRECPDPGGYLDEPGRDQDVDAAVKRLVDAKKLHVDAAGRIERLAEELRPHLAAGIETRVNLKIARELGVTIPGEVLKRADRIVE